MPEVSIIVPVYNESENIDLMYQEIVMSLKNQRRSFEIIIVDDGSYDDTQHALREIAKIDQRVKLVLLKRNFGQTAAMMAGIQEAQGDSIVTIDGDLQNDPDDIPMMLDRLDEGFDLVHGWRKNRQDKLISRILPSVAANWIISRITKFPIRDLGCTLKAMRSDVAKQLELYGEMHRFIPILAHQHGAKCIEVVIGHRARQFGTSKYGLDRTCRVILDLLTVKFLTEYRSSPMQLLGMIGLIAGGVAATSGLASLAMVITSNFSALASAMFIVAVVAAAVGVQMVALGAIAETCIRIYFTANDKQSFQIEERINFETTTGEPVSDQSKEDGPEFPRLAA